MRKKASTPEPSPNLPPPEPPIPPPPPSHWAVRHLYYEGRELALEEGWEPFGFSNGWIMLRKWVSSV